MIPFEIAFETNMASRCVSFADPYTIPEAHVKAMLKRWHVQSFGELVYHFYLGCFHIPCHEFVHCVQHELKQVDSDPYSWSAEHDASVLSLCLLNAVCGGLPECQAHNNAQFPMSLCNHVLAIVAPKNNRLFNAWSDDIRENYFKWRNNFGLVAPDKTIISADNEITGQFKSSIAVDTFAHDTNRLPELLQLLIESRSGDVYSIASSLPDTSDAAMRWRYVDHPTGSSSSSSSSSDDSKAASSFEARFCDAFQQFFDDIKTKQDQAADATHESSTSATASNKRQSKRQSRRNLKKNKKRSAMPNCATLAELAAHRRSIDTVSSRVADMVSAILRSGNYQLLYSRLPELLKLANDPAHIIVSTMTVCYARKEAKVFAVSQFTTIQKLLSQALRALADKHELQPTEAMQEIACQAKPHLCPLAWTNVVVALGLLPKLAHEDVVQYAQDLIQRRKFKDAALYVTEFGIHEEVDFENIVSQLCRQSQFPILLTLMKKLASKRYMIIHRIGSSGRNPKLALKYAEKFDIPHSDFPDFVKQQHQGAVAWLIKTDKIIEFADVVLKGKPDLLMFAIDNCVYRHKLREALDIATKYLEQSVCYSIPSLAPHIPTYLQNPDAYPYAQSADETKQAANGTVFFQSPLAAPDRVLMIDSPESIEQARKLISPYLRTSDSKINSATESDADFFHKTVIEHGLVVGLDAEFIPSFTGSSSSEQGAALLQLSTPTQAILMDLLKFSPEMDAFLYDVLTAPQTIKLGYGFVRDMKGLRKSYRDAKCFKGITNLLDLDRAESAVKLYRLHAPAGSKDASASTKQLRGLSNMLNLYTGTYLRKDCQMSNWARRPLRDDQVTYAALDAMIECIILKEIVERFEKDSDGNELFTALRKQIRTLGADGNDFEVSDSDANNSD
jgi:3'-5' exonuclease